MPPVKIWAYSTQNIEVRQELQSISIVGRLAQPTDGQKFAQIVPRGGLLALDQRSGHP
jgi:hypothetical protein